MRIVGLTHFRLCSGGRTRVVSSTSKPRRSSRDGFRPRTWQGSRPPDPEPVVLELPNTSFERPHRRRAFAPACFTARERRADLPCSLPSSFLKTSLYEVAREALTAVCHSLTFRVVHRATAGQGPSPARLLTARQPEGRRTASAPQIRSGSTRSCLGIVPVYSETCSVVPCSRITRRLCGQITIRRALGFLVTSNLLRIALITPHVNAACDSALLGCRSPPVEQVPRTPAHSPRFVGSTSATHRFNFH